VLLPLSRDKTAWAAYCDSCLIGSFVYRFDDHNDRTARYAAVAKLSAIGWTHEVPKGIPDASRGIASHAWTGQTFCFECSESRARQRRSA
jgi:hypothetical protein